MVGLAAFATASACGSDDDDDSGNSGTASDSGGVQVAGMSLQAGASGSNAVPAADALWQQIQGCDSWALVPGTEERQASATAHAMAVTVRYSRDLDGLENGLTAVRENYFEDASLEGVTVMLKATDFDPNNADWLR